jgi:hypothetical protein
MQTAAQYIAVVFCTLVLFSQLVQGTTAFVCSAIKGGYYAI